MVIGICGGFQMLGKAIRDPLGMETAWGEIKGLGLLDVETILMKEKRTYQVKAIPLNGFPTAPEEILQGYEIHMGETARGPDLRPAFKIIERLNQKVEIEDGAVSPDGMVWGTYIHGLFENDRYRRRFIESLKKQKGLSGIGNTENFEYTAFKERVYDGLAAALREALDVERIYRIIGIK
jgi:adenosylcobyric acid synthase